jgi:hypothetical protein
MSTQRVRGKGEEKENKNLERTASEARRENA